MKGTGRAMTRMPLAQLATPGRESMSLVFPTRAGAARLVWARRVRHIAYSSVRVQPPPGFTPTS